MFIYVDLCHWETRSNWTLKTLSTCRKRLSLLSFWFDMKKTVRNLLRRIANIVHMYIVQITCNNHSIKGLKFTYTRTCYQRKYYWIKTRTRMIPKFIYRYYFLSDVLVNEEWIEQIRKMYLINRIHLIHLKPIPK